MQNNNVTKRVHQGDIGAVFESELAYQLVSGTHPIAAEARALAAADKLKVSYTAPDESRLTALVTLQRNTDQQTRGGEFADLDATYRALETVSEAIAVSSSNAHQQRVRDAISDVLGSGKANAGKRQARSTELKLLRKSIRTVIAHRRPDEHAHLGTQYAETLLKIEAELAYLGGTGNGAMHLENVVSFLPKHTERVGVVVLRERFKALFLRYSQMYVEAALAAVETGAFAMPKMITGRDIGKAHTINAVHLSEYFPHGRHGIRAADRDEINADRLRRGLKVRTKARKKSREEIRLRAAEQRELEMLMEHFGVERETVYRWRCRNAGDTYLDRLELMENDRCNGIMRRTPDSDLAPELRAALMDHFDVGPGAVRQWKKRRQLDARIRQYRRENTLNLVD